MLDDEAPLLLVNCLPTVPAYSGFCMSRAFPGATWSPDPTLPWPCLLVLWPKSPAGIRSGLDALVEEVLEVESDFADLIDFGGMIECVSEMYL
jgi:hypothetical protein